MKLYFDIPEFCKLDGHEADLPITPTLAQKVMQYHLLPLNEVRVGVGLPVYIRSGYRPVWWELAKGRDGTSQHCYEGQGATDCSIERHSDGDHKAVGEWVHFLKLLKQTPYKRIAYYPNLRFFHCDYRGDKRKYYINREGWHLSGVDALATLIGKSEPEGQ